MPSVQMHGTDTPKSRLTAGNFNDARQAVPRPFHHIHFFVKISLWRCHAHIVKDGALSHKVDIHTYFLKILNLEGHLYCMIGSKVTVFLFESIKHIGTAEIVT